MLLSVEMQADTLSSMSASLFILLAVQLPKLLQHIIPDMGMPDGNWVRIFICRPRQIEQVSGLASQCNIHLGAKLIVAVSCKLRGCCPT